MPVPTADTEEPPSQILYTAQLNRSKRGEVQLYAVDVCSSAWAKVMFARGGIEAGSGINVVGCAKLCSLRASHLVLVILHTDVQNL